MMRCLKGQGDQHFTQRTSIAAACFFIRSCMQIGACVTTFTTAIGRGCGGVDVVTWAAESWSELHPAPMEATDALLSATGARCRRWYVQW